MEPQYISKREACQLLGISLSTLERRIRAGEITPAARDADGGQFSRVWFTRESLGLPPEPEPAENFSERPEPDPSSKFEERPEQEPSQNFCERPLTDAEQRIADDLQFADAYLKGEIADSTGNTIKETRHSLLGPQPPVERHRPDSTAHMDAALLPDLTQAPGSNPVDSDAVMERWHPGHTERKAQQSRAARLPAQRQKQVYDYIAIATAFRYGYSR